ncbi:hypothetical protein LguiA_007609 [Lonicera macranthoides]
MHKATESKIGLHFIFSQNARTLAPFPPQPQTISKETLARNSQPPTRRRLRCPKLSATDEVTASTPSQPQSHVPVSPPTTPSQPQSLQRICMYLYKMCMYHFAPLDCKKELHRFRKLFSSHVPDKKSGRIVDLKWSQICSEHQAHSWCYVLLAQEEFRRTGMHGPAMVSEPKKPLA